jgi:predicted DNA-binding transcriptional regulator YafY
MADVTGRMLALLAELQTGRAFSGNELAARLGVSLRTLRRDVERLRGLGYPVETRPGPGGHYRLTAGIAMPPLMLEDDEAIATVLGLAVLAATGSAAAGSLDDAANRAYGKAEQYLPKRLRGPAAALRGSLEADALPAPSTSAAVLGALAEAIGHRRLVTFDYVNKSGEVSSRRVEPHRQIHHLLRWYVLAWDTGRDGWRAFRSDRISDLRISTFEFEPRPLPADTAINYLSAGLNRDRQRVVVTIEAPVTAVADAFKYQEVELSALDERRTKAILKLDTWEWLLTPLAFLDADFEVVEPPEFRAALQRFAARSTRTSGPAPGATGKASPPSPKETSRRSPRPRPRRAS